MSIYEQSSLSQGPGSFNPGAAGLPSSESSGGPTTEAWVRSLRQYSQNPSQLVQKPFRVPVYSSVPSPSQATTQPNSREPSPQNHCVVEIRAASRSSSPEAPSPDAEQIAYHDELIARIQKMQQYSRPSQPLQYQPAPAVASPSRLLYAPEYQNRIEELHRQLYPQSAAASAELPPHQSAFIPLQPRPAAVAIAPAYDSSLYATTPRREPEAPVLRGPLLPSIPEHQPAPEAAVSAAPKPVFDLPASARQHIGEVIEAQIRRDQEARSIDAIKQAADRCNDSHSLSPEEIQALVQRANEELAADPTSRKIEAKDHHLARSMLIIDGTAYILMTKTEQDDVPLGDGAFKNVKRVIRIPDGKTFAVGVVRKANISDVRAKEIRDEIEIMRDCSRLDNVVQLEDSLETADKFYIITELCEGGDLYYFLDSPEGQSLSLRQRVQIGTAFANGAANIRRLGYHHRDLKTENAFPIVEAQGRYGVKISDFGAARPADMNHPLNIERGTPEYLPPELARLYAAGVEDPFLWKYHSEHQDRWNLGVALYKIIHPTHAFPSFAQYDPDNRQARIGAIGDLKDADIDKELDALKQALQARGEWTSAARKCIGVIKNLLRVDCFERCSQSDAFRELAALGA